MSRTYLHVLLKALRKKGLIDYKETKCADGDNDTNHYTFPGLARNQKPILRRGEMEELRRQLECMKETVLQQPQAVQDAVESALRAQRASIHEKFQTKDEKRSQQEEEEAMWGDFGGKVN